MIAPRAPRYHCLDAWRGVACLMVAALHSCHYLRSRTPFDSSEVHTWFIAAVGSFWIGVPLFFVISGYCIMAAADNLRRRPEMSVREYFRRRIRRIFPPYWWSMAMLLVVIVISEVWLKSGIFWDAFIPYPDPSDYSLVGWLHNLALTAPFVGERFFVGVAWTLAYEEQFYIVMGLCLIFARRRLGLAITIVTALVLVLMQVGPLMGIGLGKFFFNGYWLAFAAGTLVYGQSNYGSKTTAPIALGLLITGAAYGIVLAQPASLIDFARQMIHSAETKIALTTFVGCAFAVVLMLLKPYDARLKQTWVLRPLMWTGTMCYSIYLSHRLVVELISHGFDRAGVTHPWVVLGVVVPLCLAASIAVGWMFFMLVERRFLNTPPASRTTADEPETTATTGSPLHGAALIDAPSPAPAGVR